MAAQNPTTDSLAGPRGSAPSQASLFTRARRPALGAGSIGSVLSGGTEPLVASSGPARA